MLTQLHRRHTEFYRLDHAYEIDDFLITDQAQVNGIEQSNRIRSLPEKLFIAADGEAVEVGVFLDAEVLRRLATVNPLEDLSDAALSDLWLVVEGISHFNYVVFNAARDKSVSLLELELQAEIDKYVSTLMLADEQGYAGVDTRLHERLFDWTRLGHGMDARERERYAVASRYAAAYCRVIRRRHRSDHYRFLDELRNFYRLDQPAKISRIHTLTT